MEDFKTLNLGRTYSSLHSDLVKDLTVPLLERAVTYNRAVGFFSSSWLREVSKGMAKFARKGGKARIVTSIRLSEEDWKAIQKGYDKQKIEQLITYQIQNVIEELEQALEEETLATLSWMISEDILDFRFGIPIGRLHGGIFHTKLSIFFDKYQNGVALFGSQNDSLQATKNEETLNVFTTWDHGKEYFDDHLKDFEEKWNGNNSTLKSFRIPEAARYIIVKAGEGLHCPYINTSVNYGLQIREPSLSDGKKLRDYQEKAITAWEKNDYRGLFAMATGTGKTFTAIASSIKLYETLGSLAVIILVPYQHLVEQWYDELCEYGFDPIRCYSSYPHWYEKASTRLREFKNGVTKHFCCITSNDSAVVPRFQELIKKIDREWLLIADEVHELGAKSKRAALFPEARFRIGLSATPSRWYDEEGTEVITKYFNKKVIEFGLKEAINSEFLTNYDYYVIPVELTNTELEEYIKETRIISRLYSNKEKNTKQIEIHALKRARILGGAKNKLPALLKQVRQHRQEEKDKGNPYTHNLFYCNPGEHRAVLKALSDEGMKVHEFVHSVSKQERARVLDAFANAEIQGIVAVKCLDQGVDIPATKRAYILASSTNPRQYIQRRGRILRKAQGKHRAFLFDFMVGPWNLERDYPKKMAQSLLKRELPRFVEFNDLSMIKYKMKDYLLPMCEHYGMVEYLSLAPWDIYRRVQEIESDVLISQTEFERE